jgi:hypothetical protein
VKRREAKALGLATYNTGKPCKHGHLSDRYVKSAQCIECVYAQSKEWRQANPESYKQSCRKWLESNRDVHNVRVKRWQAKNKAKIAIDQKAWEKANPDKVKAKTLRWREKHPEKYTALAVASVARRAKRVPKWNTSDDRWLMAQFYDVARLRTKATGVVWEVDHIIPLRGKAVSGLHVPSNLQVILKSENRAKRNFVSANLA